MVSDVSAFCCNALISPKVIGWKNEPPRFYDKLLWPHPDCSKEGRKKFCRSAPRRHDQHPVLTGVFSLHEPRSPPGPFVCTVFREKGTRGVFSRVGRG